MNALERDTELVVIETRGDRMIDRALNQIGGAGVFIKEIESALIEDRIDVAVHSLKDLPSVIPEGLSIAATLERLDARDALVSREAESIRALPQGARMATGSLRRRSQLLGMRPDLEIEDLRGNVGTRLNKFDASSWEAIVLAAAGLVRMGVESRIRARIPIEEMIPAVGQGALALETRADDRSTLAAVERLNHEETERAVACERAFLRRLEGGCQIPIGAFAEVRGEELRLLGFVGSVDGSKRLRRDASGRADDPEALGLSLAEAMLDDGAQEIIREVVGVDD